MTATAPYSPPTCPRCGRSLPADAPAGLCPQCLLSDGFGDQSEPTGRFTGRIQPRFVPPTIEELASEFPHLDFVQLLGSGGMGAVYLANQVRLARPVAVKILPPDLADDASFAERFLREARALARLSHPNIVGVFDFGQTPGGLYYFLMEYIEGPTLRQIVMNRSADPKQALEIVRQVCDALQYAHDKGVVHRDIKPENVLLDGHGRVKIADFGLAKLLGLAETAPGSPAAGSLTGTRQAMGTPHYMAPEQIMGSRSVDHRADIYSLGVVFYELLTGELPLGRFAAPSKKVQIDVRLDDVVLRTLEAEPEQRYQKASDVKTDVDTISSMPPAAHAAAHGPSASARRYVRGVGDEEVGRTVFDHHNAGSLPRNVKIAGAFAIVAAVCLMLVVASGAIGGDEAAAICAAVVGWFGVPSAICASVLAITATGEIRRSDGRLRGLVPAVAVALVIPLLLLDGLIWFVCLLPGFLIAENILGTGHDDPALVIATLIAVPVSLLVDFCVLRYVWQWATRGLSPERVQRELSVIPPELQEFGSQVGVFLDKVLRALKPIQRRQDWHAAPRRTPQPVSRYVAVPPASPTPPVAEKPVLRSVDEPVATAFTDADARLSRKALVGVFCLAMALPLIALCIAITDTFREQTATVLCGMIGLVVFTGLFAATILGWLAVGDIRRSRGRLVGLPLAVFDGLFCPLLLIDAVLFALAIGLGIAVTEMGFYISHRFGPDGNISLIAIPTGLVASVLMDFMIAHTVWRRVRLQPRHGDALAPSGISWDESRSEDIGFIRRHREFFAAAVAVGVAVALMTWKVAHDGGFEGRSVAPPVAHVAPNAPAAPTLPHTVTTGQVSDAADSNRRWTFGPHGPEVSSLWARSVGLSPEQQDRINKVLQDTYAAHQGLIEEHTTAERNGDRVMFTIAAFSAELERLTNEFWSDIDPLLSRDQQAMMRYNFPLRLDRDRTVHSSEDIILLFGAERFTVSIERTGLWFRWSISGPIGWSSTTPELPNALTGWQERLNRVIVFVDDGATATLSSVPVIAPRPGGN